ncbi:uncharacterized protein LOC133180378 [Saccostrea echinata]|uniref:uncharacterized protein LOC133180378 n=1 Tax=Saccostrea echinata TaxID=191078 RepID=UPI002A805D3C|nr:uncharacterized protein LOC133180378 [Saccostrea echinata]
MEAQTVARRIVEEVISRFGVPVSIHSDQGRQYESLLFSEVCKHLQIRKTRTTPHHPQSDGMVERFNKTLATMLSSYVSENHRDWDENIPFVMMAYRASQHESTGYSPNMLMLDRETATPLDIIYNMPASWKQVLAKVSEVLYKLNCGRNGNGQVVNCDRIKACKSQVLRGEDPDLGHESTELETSDSSNVEIDLENQDDDFGSSNKNIEVTDELAGDRRPRRERRTPTWLKDYVQD